MKKTLFLVTVLSLFLAASPLCAGMAYAGEKALEHAKEATTTGVDIETRATEHAGLGVKHTQEGIVHVKDAIKHLEESLQASNNPHAKEAIGHAKEAIKHAEEAIMHAEEAAAPKKK